MCSHGCAYGGKRESNDYCVQNRLLKGTNEGNVTVVVENDKDESEGEDVLEEEWVEGQAH